MHDPCIFLFLYKKKRKANKKKQNKKKQKQRNNKKKVPMKHESHTTFLVTCVGYHDDGYKPTKLGLYTHFSKNKWLKIIWIFRDLNLIITFSMHIISMPESFISMIGWWSIANQNFFFLDYGVEPSTCFNKRFIKSRSSIEVTSLQKLGQKMDQVT